MADQTQPWAERTVEVPPQDPWAPQPEPSTPAFQRGVAHVAPRPQGPRTDTYPVAPHEPTGTGWPGATAPEQRMPLSWQLRQLRRGGESSAAAALFAFVCWGIWAVSSGGDLTTPVLVFLVTLLVAAGVFALSRLLGRLVLERQLGRVRRSARGAHLAATVFLLGVGFAYLRQTGWVMDVWGWVKGLF